QHQSALARGVARGGGGWRALAAQQLFQCVLRITCPDLQTDLRQYGRLAPFPAWSLFLMAAGPARRASNLCLSEPASLCARETSRDRQPTRARVRRCPPHDAHCAKVSRWQAARDLTGNGRRSARPLAVGWTDSVNALPGRARPR